MSKTIVPVTSSSVSSVTYDPEGCVLELQFHNGGVYHYFAVPQRVFEELLAAPSMGAFVNQHIKPKYPFTRVDQP